MSRDADARSWISGESTTTTTLFECLLRVLISVLVFELQSFTVLSPEEAISWPSGENVIPQTGCE